MKAYLIDKYERLIVLAKQHVELYKDTVSVEPYHERVRIYTEILKDLKQLP